MVPGGCDSGLSDFKVLAPDKNLYSTEPRHAKTHFNFQSQESTSHSQLAGGQCNTLKCAGLGCACVISLSDCFSFPDCGCLGKLNLRG